MNALMTLLTQASLSGTAVPGQGAATSGAAVGGLFTSNPLLANGSDGDFLALLQNSEAETTPEGLAGLLQTGGGTGDSVDPSLIQSLDIVDSTILNNSAVNPETNPAITDNIGKILQGTTQNSSTNTLGKSHAAVASNSPATDPISSILAKVPNNAYIENIAATEKALQNTALDGGKNIAKNLSGINTDKATAISPAIVAAGANNKLTTNKNIKISAPVGNVTNIISLESQSILQSSGESSQTGLFTNTTDSALQQTNIIDSSKATGAFSASSNAININANTDSANVPQYAAINKPADITTNTAEIVRYDTPRPQTSAAEQVRVHIANAAQNGDTNIQVKLSPAELGRVEIKLDIAHDGVVKAMVIAERPETLDMLQRDAKMLEKALMDNGMKLDAGQMSFNLRGGENGQQEFKEFSDMGDNTNSDTDNHDDTPHMSNTIMMGNGINVLDIHV